MDFKKDYITWNLFGFNDAFMYELVEKYFTK